MQDLSNSYFDPRSVMRPVKFEFPALPGLDGETYTLDRRMILKDKARYYVKISYDNSPDGFSKEELSYIIKRYLELENERKGYQEIKDLVNKIIK